jgi:hypothetical protein
MQLNLININTEKIGLKISKKVIILIHVINKDIGTVLAYHCFITAINIRV